MQIKCTTLFSFAKINHNWAGRHTHRGNLMTHFVFGSCTPNLSALLPCALLCVHTLHSLVSVKEYKKKKKKKNIWLSKVLCADSIASHFIFLFTSSIRHPELFFSFFPYFWDADSNFRLSGSIWNSVSFSNGTEVIELSYTLISSHSQILITVSEFKR